MSTDKRVSGMKPPEAKERTTEKEKDTREQYSEIHGDRISPQTRAQDLKFKESWVKYHKQPCLQSRKESSLRPKTALIPAKKSQPRKIKMLSSHCVDENS